MRREIDPTLLGQLAMDPFYGATSAARGAMMAAHIGQAPVMVGNEPRRIFTGVEPHYAQHSFDVKAPDDLTILDTIRKYPTGFSETAIRHNPLTTVIYEEYYSPTKTIGVMNIPDYIKLHQDFGFPLKKDPEMWDRVIGKDNLAKGEVIASSPAIKPNGLYGLGISAEVAFMSDPGGIEDGFVVSEEFLERMSPFTYNKYIANVGKKSIFLNLYGDEKHYKPFPDIGDRVREDGVIMATREIDENLAPAEMTARALRTIDHAFDRCTYAKPGAVVKDIMVLRDTSVYPSNIPTGMDTQLNKYYEAGLRYYQNILNVYTRLLGRRGKGLQITAEFNELVVEALTYMPAKQGQRKLTRMYRLEMLDEYRVEITTEARMWPDNGFKLTDLFGGKGVVCLTRPAKDMPITKHGVRVDIIIYGGSTIRRSNFGRMYEQYYNAASRDLLFRLRAQCGLISDIKPTEHQLKELSKNKPLMLEVWNTLNRYFELWAPVHKELVNEVYKDREADYVIEVLADRQHVNHGITVNVPVDNPVDLLDTIRKLQASEFRPHYDTVTYVDNGGKTVETEIPVLVGAMQMILLEKIGEDWSGVASARTQQFGLPAKMGGADANRTPGRENPMRSAGESETRSMVAVVGGWATNELLDQTKNPLSHREVVRSLFDAKEPSNIHVAVPRDKVPYGQARSVALMQHLLECRGVRFVYRPDQ